MKINSLLESSTPSSDTANSTSTAPEFGRSDKFLEEKDETVEESTTSGSVATVAAPIGGMQRRAKGSMLQGIKSSAKYPNSKAVKEGKNSELDSLYDQYDELDYDGNSESDKEKMRHIQQKIKDLKAKEKKVNESRLAEVNPHNFDSDVDYYAAKNAPAKPRYRGTSSPGVNPDDEAYFREIFRKKRLAAQKAERDADHDRLATGTNEGEEFGSFASLKDWQVWDVRVSNNYYAGKYADYGPRLYSVVAGSEEEARKVVLANADYVLQDLLSRKLQNGKRVLPRGSALPIEEKRVGKAQPGSITTVGFKEMLTPQGPMKLKFSNGQIVGSEDGEVDEGMFGFGSSSKPSQQQKPLDYNAVRQMSNQSGPQRKVYVHPEEYRKVHGEFDEAKFDYTMKDMGDDYAGFPSNHSMKHKMLARIKPEKQQLYKDKMNNTHDWEDLFNLFNVAKQRGDIIEQTTDEAVDYDKHSFIGKIRRGREADNKGWGQLGQLFAAGKDEKAAEKALRKGNRYYNMTRGDNKTPGGFPKTTIEEQDIDEAGGRIPGGLSWTGGKLQKRPELVAAARQKKNRDAAMKRKALKVANAVVDLVAKNSEIQNSNEPYRAAMYELGFEEMDGTTWWKMVMKAIDNINSELPQNQGVAEGLPKEQDGRYNPDGSKKKQWHQDPHWQQFAKEPGVVSQAKFADIVNRPKMQAALKRKGMAEEFNPEYDDEAGSAESNLHTIARAAQGLIDSIGENENLPEWAQEKIAKVEGMLVAVWDYLESQEEQGIDPQVDEDWQKTNKQDKTDGMSPKAVKAYRRENPGSKLKTAVTKKPSELKAGSKDAKRRKSFCARMSGNKGPMKDEKGRPTPKAKALSRWNCESVEQTVQMLESVQHDLVEMKQRLDPKCWKGYKKQGTKMKGDTRVNNCVPVSEAEVSEDKLASDLYKDLQIFKKGADKDIGGKAKDKEISSKAKDKEIQQKK